MTNASVDLVGSSILITGGGSGIGLGCAVRLVSDGAHVTVCGRSKERLTEATAQIRGAARSDTTVQWISCDVTDEEQVKAAVDFASSVTGRVDGVVACAGGNTSGGPVTQLDLTKWRETLDLNITGTMLMIKHAGQVMAKQGAGCIIGISSIAASNTHRWFGAYGVAKSGIDYLCQLAADELGPSGVLVNCIRPGLINTDLTRRLTAPGPIHDDYIACTPLGRYGQVEDVAALARFLLSPEASWITGVVVNVDGGHHLRRGPDISSMLAGAYTGEQLRGLPGSS